MATLLQTISNAAAAYLGYGLWVDGSIGQTFTVDFYGSIEEIWFDHGGNTGTDHYLELYDSVGGNLLATGTPSVAFPARFTLDSPVMVSSGEDFYAKIYDATDGYILIRGGTIDHAGGTTYINDAPYVWGGGVYPDFYVRLYGTPGPAKATTPNPTNTETDVSKSLSQLSWENGGGATSYDVYFGPSGNMTLRSSGQAGTTFDLSSITLDYNTTYQWRIDSTNDDGTTTGDTWSFTTEAFDPPVPSGLNAMVTIRRAVAAADNKLFYET